MANAWRLRLRAASSTSAAAMATSAERIEARDRVASITPPQSSTAVSAGTRRRPLSDATAAATTPRAMHRPSRFLYT